MRHGHSETALQPGTPVRGAAAYVRAALRAVGMPRRSLTPVPLESQADEPLRQPDQEQVEAETTARVALTLPSRATEPPTPFSRASGGRPASRGAAVAPSAAMAATPLSVRLDELDDQLLGLIMRHIPTAECGRVCGVCRAWARVAGDEQLWHLRARVDLNAASRTPWCPTWRATYQDALTVRIGDCVEVRDMYGLWVTGRIMARLDPLRMLVYFEGWSDKWLIWIDRADDRTRIRPLGSVEGDCPGLGSSGPLSAETFASKCGAVHARLTTVDRGRSVWPPPSREHLGKLPAMYNAVGATPGGTGSRPGSAVRPSSVRRGPLAWHAPLVDGSISLCIADAARWQRQQQLLSRREFRPCREIAAANYAAAHAPTEQTQVAQLGGVDCDAAAQPDAQPHESKRGTYTEGANVPEPVIPTHRADEANHASRERLQAEHHYEMRTLDSMLLQAPPPVIVASGGEAASRNPYKVGQVLELSLNGMEKHVLPTLRGASAMQPATLTGRVMVRLDARVFLVQCEGWRHEGLVWLHAELDAHRIAPLGPEGPRGIGDDGPMTSAVFERLQFGIMMLLSQGISYWDAPDLLHAEWTKTATGAGAGSVTAGRHHHHQHHQQQRQLSQGRGDHIPPSSHSSTFRSSEMVGLGFELASPSAKLSVSNAAIRTSLRRGSTTDSESSGYLPVPATVADAFAAGYRREAGVGHQGTADGVDNYIERGRAVGKPQLPPGDPTAPAGTSQGVDGSDSCSGSGVDDTTGSASPRTARGGRRRAVSAAEQAAGRGNPLESGGHFEPTHLATGSLSLETEQRQQQAEYRLSGTPAGGLTQQYSYLGYGESRHARTEAHDPNRLSLYQHEASASDSGQRISYGLEIRLSHCEQWRAHQERPPFRTVYQVWGIAKATANAMHASQPVGRARSATHEHTAGGSRWALGQSTRGVLR